MVEILHSDSLDDIKISEISAYTPPVVQEKQDEHVFDIDKKLTEIEGLIDDKDITEAAKSNGIGQKIFDEYADKEIKDIYTSDDCVFSFRIMEEEKTPESKLGLNVYIDMQVPGDTDKISVFVGGIKENDDDTYSVDFKTEIFLPNQEKFTEEQNKLIEYQQKFIEEKVNESLS